MLTGLEGRLPARTEMPRAWRAGGPLVGEGPLARVGLSHVLFSDGGVGVGITRMPVTNPRWWEPTTIGAYHHVVYSYAPISVSFEGAGDYVVTPNEVVCQAAGQVYQRTQLHSGEELSVFAAVDPAACADSRQRLLVELRRARQPAALTQEAAASVAYDLGLQVG